MNIKDIDSVFDTYLMKLKNGEPVDLKAVHAAFSGVREWVRLNNFMLSLARARNELPDIPDAVRKVDK